MSDRYCGLVKWSQLVVVMVSLLGIIVTAVIFGISSFAQGNKAREEGDTRVEGRLNDFKDYISEQYQEIIQRLTRIEEKEKYGRPGNYTSR